MGHSEIVIEDALENITIRVTNIIDIFVLQRTKRIPSNKELRLILDVLEDRPGGRFLKKSHAIQQLDVIGSIICPKECIPWKKLESVPSFKQVLFRKVVGKPIKGKNGRYNPKLIKVRKRCHK